MEELLKRLERVIATGAPDKNGQHPISAEVVLEVVKELSELSTNLAEVGTDCISRQAAIKKILGQPPEPHYPSWYAEQIKELPSAQPEPPEECERCMMEHTDEMEKLEAELAMAQPKRGQWHYSDGKPARIGLSFGVICDQCGTESEYCTNFCGECGADMREVTT